MCVFHLHESENIKPKCLKVVCFLNHSAVKNKSGRCTGFNFLDRISAIVFFAWNSTSHASTQSEIVCRSPFSTLAARSERSRMVYRLVSSEKRPMKQAMYLTVSFIYNLYTKNGSGPKMEPWGISFI